MTGRGYELVGVTYDPHDRRVEIILGDATRPKRHLMRSIANAEMISVTTEAGGGREVLEIRRGRGHTLVTTATA